MLLALRSSTLELLQAFDFSTSHEPLNIILETQQMKNICSETSFYMHVAEVSCLGVENGIYSFPIDQMVFYLLDDFHSTTVSLLHFFHSQSESLQES